MVKSLNLPLDPTKTPERIFLAERQNVTQTQGITVPLWVEIGKKKFHHAFRVQGSQHSFGS
jgi:hypothetical protein